ncbi:hypothetical protein F4167_01085 [Candidatus Poribacteria bacterium]|nr:hypothetical protein [Candidatus Poribacteria bacterium]
MIDAIRDELSRHVGQLEHRLFFCDMQFNIFGRKFKILSSLRQFLYCIPYRPPYPLELFFSLGIQFFYLLL